VAQDPSKPTIFPMPEDGLGIDNVITYYSIQDTINPPESHPQVSTTNTKVVTVPDGWYIEYPDLTDAAGKFLWETSFLKRSDGSYIAVGGPELSVSITQNGTSPYLISLDNDTDTIIVTADGKLLGNGTSVTATLYHGMIEWMATQFTCELEGASWPQDWATYESPTLQITKAPPVGSYIFKFTWANAKVEDTIDDITKNFRLNVT
jgi:hypothetical protein